MSRTVQSIVVPLNPSPSPVKQGCVFALILSRTIFSCSDISGTKGLLVPEIREIERERERGWGWWWRGGGWGGCVISVNMYIYMYLHMYK